MEYKLKIDLRKISNEDAQMNVLEKWLDWTKKQSQEQKIVFILEIEV